MSIRSLRREEPLHQLPQNHVFQMMGFNARRPYFLFFRNLAHTGAELSVLEVVSTPIPLSPQISWSTPRDKKIT